MDRWCLTKQGVLKNDGRYDKPALQVNPRNNYAYASIDKPWQWVDYETAECTFIEAVRTWKLPPLGLAFALNNEGMVCIDLDNCIVDGCILPDAQEIITSLKSYTEVSLSGTGIHIFIYGTIPQNRKLGNIELLCYHFITITGRHLSGMPHSIEHRQETLDNLYTPLQPSAVTFGTCLIPESEVLQKATQAVNGAKFRRLWAGDITAYHGHATEHQSGADASLCRMLAYWCDNDATMIDSLFRQSGLYRDKWDEYHGYDEYHNRLTYGQMVIRYALKG